MANLIEHITTLEAKRRLAEHGPNALPEPRPPSLWRRFARQFQSPLIYVLVFAVAFDVAVWIYEGRGWPVEGLVISAVLLLNAGLGALQEFRSEQALAQLKALTSSLAWVLRDEKLVRVPSRELVPGDVVRIEAGERVPADGTLVEAQGVMADEAILTGESVPVEKPIDASVSSGTLIVRGKGLFRVTRTGPASAMGQIATMLADVEVDETPLERRLGRLGNQLALGIGAVAVLLIVAGTATEGLRRIDEVVMFAVALAIAGIPEGMPAVVTLTLALGVQRLARRHALVRRLSAVEALGSVTVIATDKTGTLTEEQMRVHAVDAPDPRAALLAMVLANDAETDSSAGDPLEIGLLAYAASQGLDIAATRAALPRIQSRAFDSAWKYMRVTVQSATGPVGYLKGAPEVILERCAGVDAHRAEWRQRAEQMASAGNKVLALASATGEGEEGLTLLGLVSLWDPPRAEVPDAIRVAQQAGVRVLMITGDHPGTARAVASEIGLPEPRVVTGGEIDGFDVAALQRSVRTANVFARVTPAHKLRLVEALKADGEIVAMTGDGVNDAPALKRSDVGIAMGKRGSDVAREVADLILLDDNFATIVGAIEEGRGIYANIQSFIRFTFSTNVALMVLVVSGAVAAYVEGLRDATGMLLVPLTALQLLWINFLGDGPPALALAVDRTPGQMTRPPRPANSGLLDPPSLWFIAINGVFKGVLGILILMIMPIVGYGLIAVQTMIFLYESIGKLVSAYPARMSARDRPANWALHGSVAVGTALQVATIVVPGLRRFLGLSPLDGRAVLMVVAGVGATWGVAAVTRWAIEKGRGAQTQIPRITLRPIRGIEDHAVG